MSARRWSALAAAAVAGAVATGPASAQSLADRVTQAPAGAVTFEYAARAGVCGDGQSYVRVAPGGDAAFSGSFDGLEALPCVHGPARVRIDRAGSDIVGLRVFVGPPAPMPGTDLGAVSARAAAAYLFQLASRGEGAVARDAIMPAVIADSTDDGPVLLALAQDRSRSRETRGDAMRWLARGGDADPQAMRVLGSIATDETDNRSVRQQALSALARFPAGAGVPGLLRLASDTTHLWVARTALVVVAQSGDPRARDYLRAAVRAAALPDEALAAAVRGFGQRYATAADIAVIRRSWPGFTGERTRSAALSAVAAFGGSENAQWLLSVAGDMGTTSAVRRRALESAVQAGVGTASLSRLYDRTTDPDTKSAIIAGLSEIGDRAATEKLLAIARADESMQARRRAIAALGRSGDARVREALAGIVVDGGSR